MLRDNMYNRSKIRGWYIRYTNTTSTKFNFAAHSRILIQDYYIYPGVSFFETPNPHLYLFARYFTYYKESTENRYYICTEYSSKAQSRLATNRNRVHCLRPLLFCCFVCACVRKYNVYFKHTLSNTTLIG